VAEQPARRDQIARSLAQVPHAADWPVLVEALTSLDPTTLRTVVVALEQTKVKPTDARSFAYLIRAGEKLGDGGGLLAVRLHNRWADTKLPVARERRTEALAAQKAWLARKFPAYRFDAAPTQGKHAWKFDELAAFVTQNNRGRNGNVARGRKIFEQGQCVKCHRFEGQGNGIGPDLTTLSKRFKRADILAAIFYPSRDINDQYQSVVVELSDGTVLTGMQGPPENQQIVLLQTDGSIVKLPKGEIAEIRPSKVSIMPEGALDVYALDEIADLLAFLESGVERSAVAGGSAGNAEASR
jgi:putative heme-binding domain-containing protein